MPMIASIASAASKALGFIGSTIFAYVHDIYFNSVSFLLKANWSTTSTLNPVSGANTPIYIPFDKDSSSSNVKLTLAGSVHGEMRNPYQPGYYAVVCGGSADYVTVPTTSVLNLGTSNYTIEFWFYTTTTAPSPRNSSGLVDMRPSATVSANVPNIFYSGSTTNAVIFYYGGSTRITSSTLLTNAWYHVALVRNSNVFTMYLNGVSQGTYSDSNSNGTSNRILIGHADADSNGDYLNGGISNLRVVIGTAVYTAAFTPPTSPLTAISGTAVLVCQANRFIDSSTNGVTVTPTGAPKILSHPFGSTPSPYNLYGSAMFNGSTDYCTINYSGAFGTSNFTIEAWVYPLAYGGTTCGASIFGTTNGATTGYSLNLGESQDRMRIISNASGTWADTLVVSTGGGAPLNNWSHIAVVRNGNSLTIFKNGVSVATMTGVSAYTFTSPNSVSYSGYFSDGSNIRYLNGYISDLRVTNGVALYTTTFTPPASPTTSSVSTSLLTYQYNASATNTYILDSGPFNYAITRSGTATAGSFSPYGDTWGVYFNNASAINLATNTVGVFTGNFTLEAWVWLDSSITTSRPDSLLIQVLYSYVGNVQFYINGTTSLTGTGLAFYDGTNTLTMTYSIPLNQWVHLAWVRSGSVFTGYVNGVGSVLSSSYSSTIGASNITYIGAYVPGTYYSYMKGYVSNLRIINGTALYSSTFTPSTTPFPAINSTTLLACQSSKFVDNSASNITLSMTSAPVVRKFSPYQNQIVTKYYSNYFNGSTDYLTTAANTGLNIGTTMCCFEMWLYPLTVTNSSQQEIFQAGTGNLAFLLLNGGAIQPGKYQTSGFAQTTATISAMTWSHIVLTADGSSNWRVFINGVLQGYQNYSFSPNNSGMTIGGGNASNGYYNGFISNFRVTVGTIPSSYVTASTTIGASIFVPPTGPLTAIAGTVLLTCQNPTFVDNSTNNITLTPATTTVRPTLVNPFTPSFSSLTPYSPATFGSSMYFNGSTDYITTATMPPLAANSFTIEFWMYNVSSGTTTKMIGVASSWAANSWVIAPTPSSTGPGIQVYNYNSSTFLLTSATAVPLNTWGHVAFVRNGTTFTVFINGIQTNTITGISTSMDGGVSQVRNFGWSGHSGDGYYNGYIADLRITNGTALYTSNFVPPVAPIGGTQNTQLLVNGNSIGISDSSMQTDLMSVSSTAGVPTVVSSVVKNSTGSYYFSGTSPQALKVTNQSVGDLTGGNFTIECWVYFLSNTSGYQPIIMYTNGAADSNGWVLYTESANQLSFLASAATNTWSLQMNTGSTIPAINVWSHIAVVRNGSTWTLYYNGAVAQTATSTITVTSQTGGMYIGYYPYFGGSTAKSFNGYIDEVRITKGVARYTGPFTPPGPMTTQ